MKLDKKKYWQVWERVSLICTTVFLNCSQCIHLIFSYHIQQKEKSLAFPVISEQNKPLRGLLSGDK